LIVAILAIIKIENIVLKIKKLKLFLEKFNVAIV